MKAPYSSLQGVAIAAILFSAAASAQIVDFRNNQTDYPTVADRDVYFLDLTTPLVGTNYQARLLYGSDASTLQPATYSTPARFRNVTTGAATAGTWLGGNRTLTGFNPGDTVILQVQVWEAGPDSAPGVPGRTFEENRDGGFPWMESDPFSYMIPQPGSDSRAFYMNNFRGISSLGCHTPGRMGIVETNGQIQISYLGGQDVEVSDDMITWTSIGYKSSPYTDTNAASLNRRFYRLRCGFMPSVFSSNYVGFYRVQFRAGYNFVGSHLILPDHRITRIFPSPPEHTTVYRYDPEAGAYSFLAYLDGAWEGTEMNLFLGEGAAVYTLVPFSKTFVGEISLRSTNALRTGYSLVSSMVPQSAPLTGTRGLSFPISEGDTVYQYNPAFEGYDVNQFLDGAWEGAAGGAPPTLSIGECFFLSRQQPGSWIRDITPAP